MSKTTNNKILPIVISSPASSKTCEILTSRNPSSLSVLPCCNAIPRRGIIAAKLMASASPEKSNANTIKALRLGYDFRKKYIG